MKAGDLRPFTTVTDVPGHLLPAGRGKMRGFVSDIIDIPDKPYIRIYIDAPDGQWYDVKLSRDAVVSVQSVHPSAP